MSLRRLQKNVKINTHTEIGCVIIWLSSMYALNV